MFVVDGFCIVVMPYLHLPNLPTFVVSKQRVTCKIGLCFCAYIFVVERILGC